VFVARVLYNLGLSLLCTHMYVKRKERIGMTCIAVRNSACEQSIESRQRCGLKVGTGTGEEVRYVTRYTLHYFFVALFPLPSVSGYNLGAVLNANICLYMYVCMCIGICVYFSCLHAVGGLVECGQRD